MDRHKCSCKFYQMGSRYTLCLNTLFLDIAYHYFSYHIVSQFGDIIIENVSEDNRIPINAQCVNWSSGISKPHSLSVFFLPIIQKRKNTTPNPRTSQIASCFNALYSICFTLLQISYLFSRFKRTKAEKNRMAL
jgi:hypothetical protein